MGPYKLSSNIGSWTFPECLQNTTFLGATFIVTGLTFLVAGIATCVAYAVGYLLGSAVMTAAIAITVASGIIASIALLQFCWWKNEEDLCLTLLNGRIIENRDQVKILKEFSPQAQVLIVEDGLFDANTTVTWTVDELNAFPPEEIQTLLNHFGGKFKSIDLEGYSRPIQSIDLSQCWRLGRLKLGGAGALQTITGLANCRELCELDLGGCANLDAHKVLEELKKIPTSGVCINCRNSSLTIREMGEFEAQLANDGNWWHFFERHRFASVYGILDASLVEAFGKLEKYKYFRAKTERLTDDFDIVPAQADELLSGRALALYRKLQSQEKLFSDSCPVADWEGITPEEFFAILHLRGRFRSDIRVDLSEVSEDSNLSKLWNGIEELDLAEFAVATDLVLMSGSGLKRLLNCERCRKLERLTLGEGLTRLDPAQTKQELLKIPHPTRLTFQAPPFTQGQNALTVQDIRNILQHFNYPLEILVGNNRFTKPTSR